MTKEPAPHTLMSVTTAGGMTSPLVIVRCYCNWRSKPRVAADSQTEYEAHVMDMGAILGPVPWRKKP